MKPLGALVRGIGEVAQKGKPFYSPIDKAISEIVQTKGTGEQMLAQILKTKGAAKELKERPAIKAALQQPKITKAELEKVAAENPPPFITEKVEKGPSEIKYKVEHDDLNDRYDVVDDYSNVVKSFRDYDDAESYATKLTGGTTRHEKWQLPGGKNYREIKLMLPLKKTLPEGFDVRQMENGKWQMGMQPQSICHFPFTIFHLLFKKTATPNRSPHPTARRRQPRRCRYPPSH